MPESPTPTLEYPYCTLLDVQRETLDRNREFNDLYIDCINLASRWIEDYTRRDFLFHDFSENPYTVLKEEAVGDSFWLRWPIQSLTQVIEMGVPLDPSWWAWDARGRCERLLPFTTIDELIAVVDPAYIAELQELNERFWNWQELARRNMLTLTGVFGYNQPQLPDAGGPDVTQCPIGLPPAVRKACALIAANWSGKRRKERVGLDGQKNDILETDVPKEAMMHLRRWRYLVL